MLLLISIYIILHIVSWFSMMICSSEVWRRRQTTEETNVKSRPWCRGPDAWTQGWGGGHTFHQCSENKGFRRIRQDLNGSCLATAWVLEVVIKVNVCSACLHDRRLYSLLFSLVNVTGDRALSYVCTHKADLMPLSLGWIVLAVNHGHLVFMKIGSSSLNTQMHVPQKRDTHCDAI